MRAVIAVCLAAAGSVVVAGLAAGADTLTVSAVDFEDSTTGTWTQSGSVTLDVADLPEGGKALRIVDRDDDFEGIQSPVGIFEPGTTYTLSMRARLAEGTAGTPGVRFVAKPAYTWIGNASISAADWTTITGSWTAPEDTDPTQFQIYIGSDNLAAPYTLIVDDILITAPAGSGGGPEPGTVVVDTDFEDGLDGWVPRDGGQGAPTLELSGVAHGGAAAALVTNRANQGAGIGYDVTGLVEGGVTYELRAWLRFAEGQPTDEVWLSLQSSSGGSQSFSTLARFDTVTNTGWTEVTASFTAPVADSAFIYFETRYQSGATGNTSDFVVDDILVRVPEPPVIEDLTGLRETVDFPLGVAIDSRETAGGPSQLLLRHFNQVTAENHMKPESWYNAERAFTPHEQAGAIMRFAQENDLAVYGHVLVWHSQTPAWFFQNEAGQPLTNSPADQQVMRDRLRAHVFAIAEHLSDTYGPFGSDTNPLNAWDVVNEVVADTGDFADGLRRSNWYNILGEQYIDLAFQYADEAFNEVYAAEGVARPVKLFINDYNTEQAGKRGRYLSLVERLLARGVPVDGVGHQFHVNLTMPVSALDAALAAFEDMPVTQAVTEFDVPTGTPVSQALRIEQGYYFRDAFNIFREYTDDLFAVTVWGLVDGRSWRSSSGAPLVFDDALRAKPAYYGAVGGQDLPPRLRTGNVFAGTVALDAVATKSLEWSKLPLHPIEEVAGFQLRWAPDHLTAYVTVTDGDVEAADAVTFELDGATYAVRRDGSTTGGASAVVTARDGGYSVVAHLPLSEAALGDTLALDVRATDGASTAGWNSPGLTGTLALVEDLSYLEVPQARTPVTIDGAIDPVWADASAVTTAKAVEGDGGAIATVRTLWQDQTLYVLAEVADPVIDVSASDPWVQDSVEIFVDAGNVKNGAYRGDDTQIRINANNVTSFGTGDEAAQAARLRSATTHVEGGYVVEAAISLLTYGGPGTFHGLDFQVNDATAGARTAIHNWADPTSLGYQTTARWGVGQLVGPAPIRNIERPRIISLLDIGLIGLPGEWSVKGARFSYQWQRDGVDIPHATLPVYIVRPGDAGHEIRLVVTARATGYAPASAASDPRVIKKRRW
ncbi:endo-1,4-beta-xylanase [Phytohabitans kaempferiae]|uniref:Beta-xylanase n=1 Tax=Phytohabitans kaempferiae TaxID=1620943 RepID=A0ABV6LXN8_9ACTN